MSFFHSQSTSVTVQTWYENIASTCALKFCKSRQNTLTEAKSFLGGLVFLLYAPTCLHSKSGAYEARLIQIHLQNPLVSPRQRRKYWRQRKQRGVHAAAADSHVLSGRRGQPPGESPAQARVQLRSDYGAADEATIATDGGWGDCGSYDGVQVERQARALERQHELIVLEFHSLRRKHGITVDICYLRLPRRNSIIHTYGQCVLSKCTGSRCKVWAYKNAASCIVM